MALTYIFTGMIILSVVVGFATGQMEAVNAAALSGACDAVELCISLTGVICIFTGFLRVMEKCGLSEIIAKLFRPLLKIILPQAAKDDKTMAAVSANVSANLLGLGNAATPLGIQAAKRMAQGCKGVASDELCMLVVMNTASIQLLPTTVAAVRSACGAAAPFDILPAVWFSSILSVSVGLLCAKLLSFHSRR